MPDNVVAGTVAARATEPIGPTACLTASTHCASVPNRDRNSVIDMPCWNWIWFVTMGCSNTHVATDLLREVISPLENLPPS